MKSTVHIIFVITVVILNTGCAVSYLKNDYQASYTVNEKVFDEKGVEKLYINSEDNISMVTNCSDDSIYSWMMFPIVPFPPILPTFKTLNQPQITLVLHGEGFTVNSPKISISQNEHVVEIYGTHEESYSAWIYWHKPDGLSCMELDNAIIIFSGILYNGEEIELPPVKINVKDLGLSFDFEYYNQ